MPDVDMVATVGRFAAGACLLVACALAVWIVTSARGIDPLIAVRHPRRPPTRTHLAVPRARLTVIRGCALLTGLLVASSVLAWLT